MFRAGGWDAMATTGTGEHHIRRRAGGAMASQPKAAGSTVAREPGEWVELASSSAWDYHAAEESGRPGEGPSGMMGTGSGADRPVAPERHAKRPACRPRFAGVGAAGLQPVGAPRTPRGRHRIINT